MKLSKALGHKDKQSAPQWQIDFARVLAGDPYTLEGLSEAEIARHKGVRCPEPVKCGQVNPDGTVRRPDQVDVYPTGQWQQVSYTDGGRWLGFYWEHLLWRERCGMHQFRRKPDVGERVRDAGFGIERGLKDV
jgi:hypothetical protein